MSATLNRNKNVRSPVGLESVNAEEVRETFLRFFVAILRRYRECMAPLPKDDSVQVMREQAFNDPMFLKLHPETDTNFLTKMLQSQMFARLIYIYLNIYIHMILLLIIKLFYTIDLWKRD